MRSGSESFGLVITIPLAFVATIMSHNQGFAMTSLLPDWLSLVIIFWAMRITGQWYLWLVFGLGLLQDTINNEIYGYTSILYVIITLLLQNARLRLLVVSPVTQMVFVFSMIFVFQGLEFLTFRLIRNGVNLPLVTPVLSACAGWWLVDALLRPVYPLAQKKDLFS